MSALPTRRYRVTVIDWQAHVGTIEAASSEEAEEKALEIRGTDAEAEIFSFEDGGVSNVWAEDIP